MGKGGMWDMDVMPDAKQMNRVSEEAMLSGKTSYKNEFRAPSKEGMRWISEEVIVQQLGPNEWSLVGVATDVTQRRHAEEARMAAESNVKQILQGADCLLWHANVVATPPTTLWKMYVPPSVLYKRIFGHDPEDNAHMLWDGQEIPEREEIHARSTRALFEGWQDYEQEFRVISKERTFWLHEHVSISKLSDTEWNLVGVIVDISARRETEQLLATEKERLAVTLRAMEEAVLTLDGQGAVLFMNRAAAELTQWDAEALAGKPVEEWCQLQLDGSGEKVPCPVQQVLRDGIPYYFPPNTRCLGRKGRSSLVEGCLMPVSDTSSRRVGAVVVLRDITEQRQMELQIHRKEKLESIGILAGGIAHDFNNILTAIMGNLNLMQMELGGQENVASYLKEAVDAAFRAKDLTQQLITFAKGGEPVRSVVILPKLVVDAVQFAVRGSSVQCQYSFPDDLWTADVDKGQISQVIHNLVLNSVQAMPQGGQIRFVGHNVRTDRQTMPSLVPGLYVCITIADTGTGISPEHIGKIFDPYFTTKQMGHGLGLAAVYSIIKKHKGHIEVSSEFGKGACFKLWLPATPTQKAPVTAETAPALKTSSLEGRRVLIMDDEEAILKLVARMIRKMGIEVETSMDGREAVEKYQAALNAGKTFRRRAHGSHGARRHGGQGSLGFDEGCRPESPGRGHQWLFERQEPR